MTHDELLEELDDYIEGDISNLNFRIAKSLRAVVEYHYPETVELTSSTGKDYSYVRCFCKAEMYPCTTVKLIEEELK